MATLRITLIGGPTALLEASGLRVLTDPTFDPPGQYQLAHTTLRKTARPALTPEALGKIDAVLLSHDQHADNLDHSGRAFLPRAGRVLTTLAGAQRLEHCLDHCPEHSLEHRRGCPVEGMLPWQTVELRTPDGSQLRVIATPARHGPAGIEPYSGDVIGFVLAFPSAGARPIYVTGDTVWWDGVAEVARRFAAGVVVLFAGAAQTRGPFNLTMNVNDAIETAHAFPDALIVPVHCDSWAHLTQDRGDIERSFAALGLGSRLRLLKPGKPTTIELRQ